MRLVRVSFTHFVHFNPTHPVENNLVERTSNVTRHAGCEGIGMPILKPGIDEIRETKMKNIVSSFMCHRIPGWKKPPGSCPVWPNPPDEDCPSPDLASDPYRIGAPDGAHFIEVAAEVSHNETAEALQSLEARGSDDGVDSLEENALCPIGRIPLTYAISSAPWETWTSCVVPETCFNFYFNNNDVMNMFYLSAPRTYCIVFE